MSSNVTGGFTRIGAGLFAWEPYLAMDDATARFWLTLYAHPHVKQLPGLCCGSVRSLAEWSAQPADVAIKAFDRLLETELIEYDTKTRVLRMTEFPDAGEWPANGFVIRSWWKEFRKLPECDVRDAHVPSLWWLIERGATESEKCKGVISDQHRQIWTETFASVKIPAPRRRGVRRLADADTSTPIQPSLFASSTVITPSPDVRLSTGYGLPVDNSESGLPSSNSLKTQIRETVSRPSGEGEGEGEGVFFSSSSSEGGSGGGNASGKPTLVLVPPPGPFTVAELAAVFASARWPKKLDEATHAALGRAIGALPPEGGEVTLTLLRDFVARGGGRYAGISPDQLAAPGVLAAAIQEAIALQRDSEAKSSALREAREQLGF